MRSVQIIFALASYVKERREIMKPNRYTGDTNEQIHAVEIKEAIKFLILRGRCLSRNIASPNEKQITSLNASNLATLSVSRVS
jgi:hypothetical protein